MYNQKETIIKNIEESLDIKLYDWVKDFIFSNSLYTPKGRLTGSTTAHILQFCLSDGKPINLKKVYLNVNSEDYRLIERYLGEDNNSRLRFRYFIDELKIIYKKKFFNSLGRN